MFQNSVVDLEHLHVESQLFDKVFSWIILTFLLRRELDQSIPVIVSRKNVLLVFKFLCHDDLVLLTTCVEGMEV
jgi:hypothetical protein